MIIVNVNTITNIRISIGSHKNSSYCFFPVPIGHIKVLTIPAFGFLHLEMNIIRCKAVSLAHLLKYL